MEKGNKIPVWPPDCKNKDSALLQAWILNQTLISAFVSQEIAFQCVVGPPNRFLGSEVYGGMVLDTKSITGRVEAV
jgi:hypothetical protein